MQEVPAQIRTLDAPWKIFFFGAGQVVSFLLLFCLGGLFNHPLIGAAFGVLMGWALGKTGSKHHRAFWRHCIYWFSPGRSGMHWAHESAQREFLR